LREVLDRESLFILDQQIIAVSLLAGTIFTAAGMATAARAMCAALAAAFADPVAAHSVERTQ
jgi:hypothetical protein